jgi:hypothetical protein
MLLSVTYKKMTFFLILRDRKKGRRKKEGEGGGTSIHIVPLNYSYLQDLRKHIARA